MTNSRGNNFDQVSKILGKNCGLFNKSIFMGHMSILGPHTVATRIFWHFYGVECENRYSAPDIFMRNGLGCTMQMSVNSYGTIAHSKPALWMAKFFSC